MERSQVINNLDEFLDWVITRPHLSKEYEKEIHRSDYPKSYPCITIIDYVVGQYETDVWFSFDHIYPEDFQPFDCTQPHDERPDCACTMCENYREHYDGEPNGD
jgi:hypothetical protein